MILEIDQSGKLEQLNTSTVVAYSNDEHGVVCITAGAKREIVLSLRPRFKGTRDLFPFLFSVITFILISKISPRTIIKIDEEYTGKEKIIKNNLEKLLKKKSGSKWNGDIRFGLIGKSSPAHQLAWKTHRQKKIPMGKKLTAAEVLCFCH